MTVSTQVKPKSAETEEEGDLKFMLGAAFGALVAFHVLLVLAVPATMFSIVAFAHANATLGIILGIVGGALIFGSFAARVLHVLFSMTYKQAKAKEIGPKQQMTKDHYRSMISLLAIGFTMALYTFVTMGIYANLAFAALQLATGGIFTVLAATGFIASLVLGLVIFLLQRAERKLKD
jgi:hypothetical protein